MDYTLWHWVGMSAVCGSACLVALYWYLGFNQNHAGHQIPIAMDDQCVFLFEGRDICSSTPRADALLIGQVGDTDWDRLRGALSDRFRSFPIDPEVTEGSGTTLISSKQKSDPLSILLEQIGDVLRVELVSKNKSGWASPTASLTDWEREVSTLWHTTHNAPYPIWRVGQHGSIVWCNPAYEKLYQRSIGHTTRADTPLFQDLSFDSGNTQRSQLTIHEQSQPIWLDITRLPHEDGHVFFANDVTPVVSAEVAQRNFVQTLAKTFAQLSIGLAIFDRKMQMVLFNPALTDLTGLPPDFLSARPNLLSFFDRLRDARVMPEPKDYTTWRDQMASMVAQANDGRYSEVWALPSGATYRVTGRPHPDGAVAFLFKDISAEMSLTRRFRTDLELSQNIFDGLDDAIAVFSASGTLAITNAAYCALWQIDPDSSFADIGIIDSMRHWQQTGGHHPLWGDIRDFVLSQDNRADWGSQVTLHDGRLFECHVQPLQHGASLVRFVEMPSLPSKVSGEGSKLSVGQ